MDSAVKVSCRHALPTKFYEFRQVKQLFRLFKSPAGLIDIV